MVYHNMNVNETSERFEDDDERRKEPPIMMAELVVTNKLLENIIGDAAERLQTIRQMAILGLEMEEDAQSFQFLFKAIKKVAMYPMTSTLFEEDFDEE